MSNSTFDMRGKVIWKGSVVRVVNDVRHKDKIAIVLKTRSGDVYLKIVTEDAEPCWIFSENLVRLSSKTRNIERYLL